MRNMFILLFAGTLAGGAVFAESDSVSTIMKELSEVAPASVPAEPAAESAVEAAAPAVETAVAEVEPAVMLDKSRALFIDGEFVEAQEGFEKVLQAQPDNPIAKVYLRCLQKKGYRSSRDAALSAVDSAWETGVLLRSYSLAADACEKLMLADAGSVTNVEALFPQVKFPEGTSAVFEPLTRTLFVRNTTENLHVFETILNVMNILKNESYVDQIEIEAKFVEVSEGALEELGFQWNFDDPVQVRGAGTDLDVYDGAGLFADGLRGSPAGTSPALPFSRVNELGAGEMSAGGGEWRAFRFNDTFDKYPANLALEYQGSDPVQMLISALDQKSGTDVLSAPRVVTEDGETATIRVGQRHFYPEVYEASGDEGNIPYIEYMDFQEKLLGVELEVTPAVVGEDITLELNPQITELVSWQNYQVLPADAAYTYYQYRPGNKYYHDPIVARLPVFKKRSIETSVTIADGSTIGMGGLINERTESYEDRVPVLGRIPLLGRLFRNEGERSVKRNLLMFVTAKRIEPNGRANSSYSFE
ncbi:MAG: hypothetical protein ISR84_04585 [Kiritimatiellales bacterium]|nr:hypothetical protein [Kiritimatiellales bacterium]